MLFFQVFFLYLYMHIHTSLESLLFSPKHEKSSFEFSNGKFMMLLCT